MVGRASGLAPRAALAGLILTALVAAGCGYHWVRSGPEVQRVAVETLGNASSEPGLEMLVTDALVRELAGGGPLRLVDDPARADLVLSGRVLPVRTRARSFSSTVFALEYEVVLRLDLEVRRRDGSAWPLDPALLAESETVLASADVEVLRKNREEALRRLAGVLAARVHDALAAELVR